MPKRGFYLFFALALSLCALWSILSPTVWYPMHDTTHIARLYLMEQTIRGGQFPPIWAEGINNGYGYPLFHFYAPLFYYVALAIKMGVGSYILALKISLYLFITVGIIGVMKLASRWGRGAALMAGTAFAFSPYLALDIYVRGAYAEIAALSLFPLVLYAWQNLETPRRQVMASVVTALFIMSHNLIPIIAIPFLGIWVSVIHRTKLKSILFPGILTFVIAAGVILPLFFERSFVQADRIARTTMYTQHFVYPSQLWNSTWGFGGSGEGIEDGMSFKLGKIQLILAAIGTVMMIVYRKNTYVLLVPVFILVALFMSTTLSQSIWRAIPAISVVQFPWRFLAISASLIAVGSSASLLMFKNKIMRRLFMIATVMSLFVINLKLFRPQTVFKADDSQYTSNEYLETIPRIIPEFMPRWMTNVPVDPPSSDLERAYYPTWRVEGEGEHFVVAGDSGVTRIVPPPESPVRLYQSHTNLERFGYVLTLVGLCIALYYGRKHERA